MTTRLAPSMTADTEFFWAAARERRLAVQRCVQCRRLRHPPRPMCPQCHSLDWDVVEASGRGTLLSFVMPHHPPLPGFEPGRYIVALVELKEGTRLVTNLVGVEPAAAAIGMAVEVCFEEFDGGLVLPMFRPAGTAA